MKTTKMTVTAYEAYDYTRKDRCTDDLFEAKDEAEDECRYDDKDRLNEWRRRDLVAYQKSNPFEHHRYAVIELTAEVEVEAETDEDGNEAEPELTYYELYTLACEQGAWEESGNVLDVTFDDEFETVDSRYEIL